MGSEVIEYVTFKLAEGVSDADFLTTVQATNAFLSECDGFIHRHLSKGDDGVWLDHLLWASMETAKAAAEGMPSRPELASFMAYVDMASVKMHHNQLMTTHS